MKIIKSLALFILAAASLLGQSAGITVVTVANSATPTLTANAGYTNFVWTLQQTVTSSTFSSPAVGAGSLRLCEDGTGGRTVAFPANFVGFTALASTALNYCQSYTWYYDGTNVTQTAGPAASGSSFNSLDTSVIYYRKSFCDGIANTGSDWRIAGAGSTSFAPTVTWPNICTYELVAPGTAGTEFMYQGDTPAVGTGTLNAALQANSGWDSEIKFRLRTTSTSTGMYVGYFYSGYNLGVPANFIGIRYDTASSDTKFVMTVCSSSTCTTSTTNTVNVDTSWHKFRIRSTSAGTILMTLDSGTETSLASNVPTGNAAAGYAIVNNTTQTGPTLDTNLFAFQVTGVTP